MDADATDPAGGLAGQLGRPRSLAVLGALLIVIYILAWAAILSGIGRSDGDGSGGSVLSPGQATPIAMAGMVVATLLAIVGVGMSASRRGRAD